MRALKNDRLYVEICEPGEMPNYTSRFDRAGFISEVILDGDIRFCASEPRNLEHPSSGGRGLCSELLFDVSPSVAVGENFPKFGIGLLKKENNDPYLFYKRYQEIPFPVHLEKCDTKVVFTTEAIPCAGYALQQIKSVEISENTIKIKQTVTNVGEKEISMQEYNHNMISIDGMAIGSDYKIKMENIFPLETGILPEAVDGYAQNFEFVDGEFRIRKYSQKASVFMLPTENIIKGDSFRWTMANSGVHAKVEVEDGFTPAVVAFWTVDHVLSVETMHDISVKPGESESWERSWTFDKI